MRRWFIEKLGGYASAEEAIAAKGGYLTIDEAIDAIRDLDLKERRVILTLAVKNLFNTIGPDDILKPAASGQWMFKNRLLTKGQVELLMLEAAQLDKMLLWEVLRADVLYQANRKMYLHAENELHVITAKFWLYTFDTMKTRLKQIAAGSPMYSKK